MKIQIKVTDKITANVRGQVVTGTVTGFGVHRERPCIDFKEEGSKQSERFCFANQITLVNGKKPKAIEEETEKFIVPVQIDGKLIDDILCTAFEGGCNYWAESVSIVRKAEGAKYASETVSRGGILHIIEQDPHGEDPEHTLDLKKMLKGLGLYVQQGGELDPGMDASEADQVLQYALFGKTIYG